MAAHTKIFCKSPQRTMGSPAGTVPFKHASIMGLYNVIRTQPVSFPAKPAVSPALKDLVAKMLCKDPARRITLPAVMQHPWTTHGNNLPLLCRQVQHDLLPTHAWHACQAMLGHIWIKMHYFHVDQWTRASDIHSCLLMMMNLHRFSQSVFQSYRLFSLSHSVAEMVRSAWSEVQ